MLPRLPPHAQIALRTLAPRMTRGFALAHDALVVTTLLLAEGSSPLPPAAARVAQLALRDGGLGRRSSAFHAPAVFWADALTVLRVWDAPLVSSLVVTNAKLFARLQAPDAFAEAGFQARSRLTWFRTRAGSVLLLAFSAAQLGSIAPPPGWSLSVPLHLCSSTLCFSMSCCFVACNFLCLPLLHDAAAGNHVARSGALRAQRLSFAVRMELRLQRTCLSENVRDLNCDASTHDARRIEVIANGAVLLALASRLVADPMHHRSPCCCTLMILSSLPTTLNAVRTWGSQWRFCFGIGPDKPLFL